MSMTDPLADMITRIRNGQKAKLLSVGCYFSNAKKSILDVLKEEGYIRGYDIHDNGKFKELEIYPKFTKHGKGVISEIKRVSKPGKRITRSIKDVPMLYNGLGIYILSTSKGVISDRKARELGVGGEIICQVF
ncbi:MAG: 30S ribosomal protein S8 [Rickettsiaceae bacterium]|nr:30S ribosomal protein S8 [Rickettsiaceae bacterium]